MAEETTVAESKSKKKMSKKKKALLISLGAIVLVVVVLVIAIVSSGSLDKGLQYKKVDGGYTVSYFNGGRGLDENITVEVPAEYKGLPVVGIGDGAFRGCGSIAEIKLPGTIETIGEYAFERCGVQEKGGGKWYFSIVFDGTQEQWDAIEKGKGWNLWSATSTQLIMTYLR